MAASTCTAMADWASKKGGGDGDPRAPAVPNGGEGGTVQARRGDGQSDGFFTYFLQGAALEAGGRSSQQLQAKLASSNQ